MGSGVTATGASVKKASQNSRSFTSITSTVPAAITTSPGQVREMEQQSTASIAYRQSRIMHLANQECFSRLERRELCGGLRGVSENTARRSRQPDLDEKLADPGLLG